MGGIQGAVRWSIHVVLAGVMMAGLASCESTTASQGAATRSAGPEHVAVATPEKTPTAALPTIRIKAGSSEPLTDSHGVRWAADTGFDGGDTIDRADLKVTGTETPELYRSERYGMNSYSVAVPNGNYTVKLHFSEDYEDLTGSEQRVFSYTVKDGTASGKTIKEVSDFSPWKAAGAQFKAYVDTVPVHVTQAAITVTFTPKVENPQINGIEIVPE